MKHIIYSALFILMIGSSIVQGQHLILDTDDVYPRSTVNGTGFEDLILKEAFKRAGYSITIKSLPAERALINVNQGIDDGLFVKIAGIEKQYPNMIMIPESVCNYEFAAFTMNPSISINGWASLKPWNVAFLRGWKMYEANITEAKSILRVKDDNALFEVLLQGRADIIAYERLEGKIRIRDKKMKGIIALSPLLAEKEMYCYLNKRHAGLIPKIAKALKDMKMDGTYQHIIDSVVGKL